MGGMIHEKGHEPDVDMNNDRGSEIVCTDGERRGAHCIPVKAWDDEGNLEWAIVAIAETEIHGYRNYDHLFSDEPPTWVQARRMRW